VGYGGPGQRPVPKIWWQRFEAFLAKRDREPDREISTPPKVSPKKAPSGQLTPHFNVREFDCKNGQRVPQFAVPALTQLCQIFLEPMRAEFGPALVMSGYRPKKYNESIGGATLSQHIYELTPSSVAADMVFSRGNPRLWALKARAIADRISKGGVGQYDKSGFVHVDNGPRRNWWG
jgi:hypothetical protein